MSGHSKWSTIKHKKGAKDAKRGAVFSKLARVIEVAAKDGANPDMNFKLKLAITKAREANMPNSNIDKAIQKGSGANKNAVSLEEAFYEGLAPGNVGVIVQAVTDNKNRTVSEIRHIFSKHGGNFGTSVSWQFENTGILQVAKPNNLEEAELAIIDSGAINFEDAGDVLEVYTKPKDLDKVKTNLESAGLNIKSTGLELVSKNKTIIKDRSMAKKVINFLELLENHDDVNEVYSTLDIPDDISADL